MKLEQVKWRAILILVVMAVSAWFGISWTWGVLFLFWIVPPIKSGHLILGDDIFREEDPILFWCSSIFLLALCGSLIVIDALPFLENLS